MMHLSRQIIPLLGLMLAVTDVLADSLSRDPFRAPANNAVQSADPGAPVVTSGAKPEIRGILAAGNQSLVNLGGQLIAIGETANGYRLLEVGEAYAVFQRGDEVITLSLFPDKENAD